MFGLYPSSLSKSVGFISLSGKASLVSIFVSIYCLFYRWSSNFVEKVLKVVLNESENGISCLLPCILLLYKHDKE